MKKLTIEYLAPYLPYGVRIKMHDRIGNFLFYDTIDPRHFDVNIKLHQIKPILRPLSDTQYYADLLSIGGKGLVGRLNLSQVTKFMTYDDVNILLKNHIDVFGLIDAGLAIDINTLSDAT